MQKPLGIQKCDGRTDQPTNQPTNLPTDQHGKVQSRVSATKKSDQNHERDLRQSVVDYSSQTIGDVIDPNDLDPLHDTKMNELL